MLELKNNMIKKYDRSIPNINVDNSEMLWDLASLIDIDMNVYQYFGLLFLRFGFEPEDNLLLLNYCKEDNSFDCVLNKNGKYGNYKIQFKKKDDQIIISHDNVIYGYVCEKIPYGELGMRVSLESYTYEYADGMIFSRYLSREKAKFLVSMCGKMIELEFRRPDDINLPLYDEHGIYAKYKLNNEEDLINYLSSSGVLCKSINDIYKELCETYIRDVSKYPEFILKRSRLNEDGSLKVIDLIHLKYGELEKFGMTTVGRTIFLDKDDNWSYEMSSVGTVSVNFLMSSQNGMISCMFSSKKENYDFTEEYIHGLVKHDIDITKKEVLRIKRKVKEMFNERADKNV